MAAKVITNFVAKLLFKQKGAIANNKAVEFSANALEERLKRFNVDPNAIKSEGELNQVLSFIKQAEDQAFTDRFGSMLQGSRFGKSGDVVDMTGKKLNPNKGIMGGTQTTEETIKENLMKTDNPFSELVKATEKGPKSLADRLPDIDKSLRGKRVPTTFSEDIERQYGLTLQGDETIQEVIDMISDINKNKKDFATGGRAGFSKGKIVKEGLAKLAQLFKKEKPKGDKIYGVGGEEIDVADLKKSLGLDEATQKKDMENLEKKLQMIIGRDRTKHATGGRAGFAMGLGPRFIKFLNETNPIEAYKKYLQSVKKRAQEGDVKSLAPELGAVGATGILVNRRMKDVLENMKNQDMENNLENFKKELDADPFYKEYPEIKDKVLENYTETMFGEKKAQGGRAGFANGSEDSGAPSITLDAKGSRSGRQQIKDAPAGITSDEETFNAILKADIPISEKIDVLSKLQYGKSRNRIEAGGQEIFLDEGGFKSRDIGLGFNKESLLEGSDSEGIGGTLMYNLETGEPEFTVGYKKKFNFAGGGRANFDEGGMSRRKFMKIMGGIATLPILGKYIKPAMPLIKKGAEITGPALDKIVETVMSAGKLISQSGKRLKELTTKKKLKDVEVEEDMMDGPSYTIKTKDKTIYYKPGKQDEMGVSDDIIEVIEDKITKKAGGGIARMLGE